MVRSTGKQYGLESVLSVQRFLLIVLSLLVSACGAESDTTAETAVAGEDATTSTPGESPATTGGDGTPPGNISGLAWSRIPHDEDVFGGPEDQEMAAVTAGGPGFIAVGSDVQVTAAAVWTSEDGEVWTWLPHNEAIFGGDGSQSMFDVVAGGPGLVAVGSSSYSGDLAAAVWTSEDGTTWSRVTHNAAVFGGEDWASMSSVTVGGPGLVAVGSTGFTDPEAAVWTSADGLTWSRVPDEEGVFGGEGVQTMHSVTAGGPGLVAVGYTTENAEDDFGLEPDAAVWTSPDGGSWTRVTSDDLESEDRQEMFEVTTGGPGLVAVGYWHGGAAVWTSVDGLAWSLVLADDEGFGEIRDVTSGGSGLVAVGTYSPFGSGGDGADAAVWTSIDGTTWMRFPRDDEVFGGDGDQEIMGVAAAGPLAVVVGSSETTAGLDATVWVGHSD